MKSTEPNVTPTRIYWPIGLSRELPQRAADAFAVEQAMTQYIERIASPGTQVTLGWMTKTTSLLSSNFLGMLNDVQVIADILAAQQAGYDAAVIGPHWDPGLYGAREAATIPVIGPLEAAAMVAQTLGRRFAVLTMHEGYVPMIERSLRQYGCSERMLACRPVRKFGMSFENLSAALTGQDDTFLRAFSDAANECIAQGADVVIAGGQLFGPVFQKFGYTTVPGTGVPVVEVASCGLKLAEALVGLRRSVGLAKSEHPNAPFRTPPADAVALACRTFGITGAPLPQQREH